jgi:hypothetical protein
VGGGVRGRGEREGEGRGGRDKRGMYEMCVHGAWMLSVSLPPALPPSSLLPLPLPPSSSLPPCLLASLPPCLLASSPPLKDLHLR